MKRRFFVALPALAAAPLPAAALRTEEASWEFVADLQDTCAAQDSAHERIRAMLDEAARGQPIPAEELRRLSVCPFCSCQVAWAPADKPR
jgi:hypothetical protein